MVAEIGDPTGDTGKGAGGTVPETWRDRTMGAAQDSLEDDVVILVGEMEITAKAEVCNGEIVTTPTPPPPHTPRRAENAGRRSELSGRR